MSTTAKNALGALKLSMMTYTMHLRPELFDLKQTLALARELGMSGVDFVTDYGLPARELRKLADDYGLGVVCHTFLADLPTPENRSGALDAVKRGLETARTLGAPCVMIPTPPKGDYGRDEQRKRWIDGLAQALPLAGTAGIKLSVENFPGEKSPFVTAADILEAIRQLPGLMVTYDNGNAGTGEEPGESFRKIAPHAVHAHFKDWLRSDTEREGYRRMLDGKFYVPALIGEGAIDQRASLKAMRECGYAGHINIEYEGNSYTPEDGVRKAVAYLRGIDSEQTRALRAK